VCRRWRSLLFESPRRLNLQLVCTPQTRARAKLDAWPALPLTIQGRIFSSSGVDNTVVALRRSSHVCKIDLWGSSGSVSKEVLAVMQQPFPEITHLQFGAYDAPIVPDSFLSGSAPRLQYLQLERIPFPGLPKLILSAIHLVELHLYLIPRSGYILPEVMITCLSALTNLERLSLGFQFPHSYLNRESQRPPPPPPTCSILPTLTYFWFRGVSEYLDDFVAHIDAPRLSNLHIIFFDQIDFDTPRLAKFIGRTPRLNVPDEAHVIFHDSIDRIRFLSRTFGHVELNVEISRSGSDRQISSMAQICTLCLPSLSTVENLYIEHLLFPGSWENVVENTVWLELLRPFNGVKDLHLSRLFTLGIGSALRELIGARITEVLPALQNIFMPKLLSHRKNLEGIDQFVAARRSSGLPVTVSLLDWPSEHRNEVGSVLEDKYTVMAPDLPSFISPSSESSCNLDPLYYHPNAFDPDSDSDISSD
jgi:hypothetical protein